MAAMSSNQTMEHKYLKRRHAYQHDEKEEGQKVITHNTKKAKIETSSGNVRPVKEEEEEEDIKEQKKQVVPVAKRKSKPKTRKQKEKVVALSEIHELAGDLVDRAIEAHNKWKSDAIKNEKANRVYRRCFGDNKGRSDAVFRANAAQQSFLSAYVPPNSNHAERVLRGKMISPRDYVSPAVSTLYYQICDLVKIRAAAPHFAARVELASLVKNAPPTSASTEHKAHCPHAKLDHLVFDLLWHTLSTIGNEGAFTSGNYVQHSHALLGNSSVSRKKYGSESAPFDSKDKEKESEAGGGGGDKGKEEEEEQEKENREFYVQLSHKTWDAVAEVLWETRSRRMSVGDKIRTLRIDGGGGDATSGMDEKEERAVKHDDMRFACVAAIEIVKELVSCHAGCDLYNQVVCRRKMMESALLYLDSRRDVERAKEVLLPGSIVFGKVLISFGCMVDISLPFVVGQPGTFTEDPEFEYNTRHATDAYGRRVETRQLASIIAAIQGKTSAQVELEMLQMHTRVSLTVHPAARARMHDILYQLLTRRLARRVWMTNNLPAPPPQPPLSTVDRKAGASSDWADYLIRLAQHITPLQEEVDCSAPTAPLKIATPAIMAQFWALGEDEEYKQQFVDDGYLIPKRSPFKHWIKQWMFRPQAVEDAIAALENVFLPRHGYPTYVQFLEKVAAQMSDASHFYRLSPTVTTSTRLVDFSHGVHNSAHPPHIVLDAHDHANLVDLFSSTCHFPLGVTGLVFAYSRFLLGPPSIADAVTVSLS